MNPPGGSGLITASSTKIGINTINPSTTLTVNGGVSVSGNQIFDVATPIGPADGVNKAYVDAQSGGGGKPLMTLYGIYFTSGGATSVGPWATFLSTLTATLKNCLIGSGIRCAAPLAIVAPQPWPNLTCPANWTAVHAGFGPYAYIQRQYYYAAPSGSYGGGPVRSHNDNSPLEGDEIPSTDIANVGYGVTYSLCGGSPYLVGQTDYTVQDGQGTGLTGIGEAAGILSACAPQGSGVFVCNICQVCQAP